MPIDVSGSPAATTSAVASTAWIALDVTRRSAAYRAGSIPLRQKAGMFGSFQTCHEWTGSAASSGWSAQNDPSRP